MKKILTMAVVMTSLIAAPARAQNTPMSPDADGGGSSFTVPCGPNHALTRIFGSMGAWLNSVRVACRQVTNDGHWIGPEFIPEVSAGGIGQQNFNAHCDTDHVISGLIAWTVLGVNQFQVMCQKLGADGAVTGPPLPEPIVGMTPGSSWGPVTCGGSNPATGLIGMAGPLAVNGIQRLGYSCGRPRVFRLESLILPFSMTAGNSATGYARFTRAVPSGTETVTLATTNETVATVDATATAASGSDRDGFTIRGVGGGCATINGVNRGSTRSGKIVVHPAPDPTARFTFTVPDNYVLIGFSANGTLAIPARGSVTLTSSNPSIATVQPTIIASANAPTMVRINGIGRGCAIITATFDGRSVRRTVIVEQLPS